MISGDSPKERRHWKKSLSEKKKVKRKGFVNNNNRKKQNIYVCKLYSYINI